MGITTASRTPESEIRAPSPDMRGHAERWPRATDRLPRPAATGLSARPLCGRAVMGDTGRQRVAIEIFSQRTSRLKEVTLEG